MSAQTWSVMQILDNTGVMSFETFSSKFNLFDRKQYDNIIKAIPQSVIQMSCNLSQNNVTLCLPQHLVNGVSITNINLSNTVIRMFLLMNYIPFLQIKM